MFRIYPAFVRGPGAVGLLILRLVVGAAFIQHGLQKIQSPGGPTGWMPAGAPVPGAFQALAAFSEFGGGIGPILGLLTPLAALLIGCTMAVAVGMVHLPKGDPFVGTPGSSSYEPAAVYLATMIMFLLVGPGVLSLDWFLFGRRPAAAQPTPPSVPT